jgi:glutamate formiminotransferase
MGHHERHQIIPETGSISQRQHGRDIRAVISKIKKCSDSKRRAKCERVDRDHDVVGHDQAGALLVSFVELLPPMRFGFNYRFAKPRIDADYFGKLGIVTRRDKAKDGEDKKDEERRESVAPGPPKRLRQFASEVVEDLLAALRVGAIDAPVSANNEAIEIVNQTRIARFGTGYGKVRRGATVDAAQFAYLFAVQATQRRMVEQLQQLLQPLPGIPALVDESILRHRGFILHTRMQRLVECVPNFSEGRKPETVQQIASAIGSVETACLLDRHIDPDHNRSVITFVATPERVVEAAFAGVKRASELIDMRRHDGVHPRLGATDVLPFVPIRGVTIEDCIALAHEAGRVIARELSIPVYYYERAALLPDRVNLEDVRRGAKTRLVPDEGPDRFHESAGALVVGARPFLLAFNVVLRSDDVAIARRIARSIRARNGGLPFLKALGLQLQTRNLVQVSMNLVNYRVTGMGDAYRAIRREADALGVEIDSAEIVGLVPSDALDRDAEYFSKLDNFSEATILENRIANCGY